MNMKSEQTSDWSVRGTRKC